MANKKICILGLGYIGLPTSVLLANRGYCVHGVDVVQSTVDAINTGKPHIVEPDLDAFLDLAVKSGKFKASLAPENADVFIIAVPTPFHNGYVPNIEYVMNATKSIAPYIRDDCMVILESTSPVGTTNMVENTLKICGVDISKIFVAYCPERVLPGHIMKELIENDRIVGGTRSESTKIIADFYREFVHGEVLETDAKTAEMTKLTENSFRDTNIAFANEISMLCDKFDINVWELIRLANRHPRVEILKPGAGVGGHCIAVDPWFIVHSSQETARLIKTSREVNNNKTEWVIEKIKNKAILFESENNRKPKIACMGLTFKPDIDDLRESPALYISKRITDEIVNVVCVEPNIPLSCHLSTINNKLKLEKLEEALVTADLIVFLVAHKEFRNLNIENALDFCGVLNS
ncbi:UDP-N-acetyl-D-mannosamine dehydrogenase [Campylobacter sp. MOP7]|uniref:UDP-N-acetyl-D-mannosamine dehydrogenase n=1 Tax=Campylobacter canis TaxID=3378588 RepID=UPI00387E9576